VRAEPHGGQAGPTALRVDLFPQGNLGAGVIAAALADGVAGARRAGVSDLRPLAGASHVLAGRTAVLRCQHYDHERLETTLDFARASGAAGIPAAHLISCGQDRAGTWWTLMSRVGGEPFGHGPPFAAFAQLVAALGALHRAPVAGGSRWGDPGVLGIFLGDVAAAEPGAYPRLASALWELTAGQALVPIHGDLGVGHNTLWYSDGQLAGIIDPGAVSVAPAAVDLAGAIAVGICDGHDGHALLGAVPHQRRGQVTDLLPPLVRRWLGVARAGGNRVAQQRCRSYLARAGAPGRVWLRD